MKITIAAKPTCAAGRFQGAGKFMGRIDCQQRILLPLYRPDHTVEVDRHCNSLQAACIHMREQATSGHYRAPCFGIQTAVVS